MENSTTSTKHREQLNTQSNAEETHKQNYPLIEREKLDNTPFHITGNPEIGYKITWGKYTFNDDPLPKEEIVKWFDENQWQIILHLIAIGSQFTEDKMRERYPNKEQ